MAAVTRPRAASHPRPASRLHPANASRRQWLLVAVSVFGALVAALVIWDVRLNHGAFTYAVDDAYIHLAIANNLAFHAVYAPAGHAFESASSSPGWTLLLAGLLRLGAPAEALPLTLNVAAGVWLLWTLARERTADLADSARAWRLVAVLTPVVLLLAPLALVGMEHVLHAALVVTLLVQARRVARDEPGALPPLLLVAFLATLVRLETALVALGIFFGLALTGSGTIRARLRAGGSVVIAASVPVVVLGVINLAHGGYFLANSIVAKTAVAGGPLGVLRSLGNLPLRLGVDPVLLTLVVGAVVVLLRVSIRSDLRCVTWAFLVAALLHLAFVGAEVTTGRYQAYLIAAGLFLAFEIVEQVGVPRLGGGAWARVALVMLVVLILPMRLTAAMPRGAHEVRSQQAQTAAFLAEAYSGRAVAVNDIGLVALRHRGPMLDLAGLASTEVLREKKGPGLSAAFLERVVREHHVDVVAIYDSWFTGIIPSSWTRVAAWRLAEGSRVTVGDLEVAFYALSPASASRLAAAIHAFEPRLPRDVITVGQQPSTAVSAGG
jgi:hypothetical protein